MLLPNIRVGGRLVGNKRVSGSRVREDKRGYAQAFYVMCLKLLKNK